MARLTHDAFNSERLLPPGNRLKIQLERSSAEFCLIRHRNSTKRYKVKWTDVRLSALRVRVTENIKKSIEMHFKSGSPIYLPFTRTDGRSFEIAPGSRHYKAYNLFSGTLPDRALLVLQDPESLGNGAFSKSPVLFPAYNFKVSNIQFYVNERAVLPRPFLPKWKEGQYVYEYQHLLNVSGLSSGTDGSCLDYEAFGQDYGVFAVKLKGFEGLEEGSVSVELRFDEPTTQAIACSMIPEFRSCVFLDTNGNVTQSDY